MLSHTDIHYLVGFLTQTSSPDAVSVELGSMVYDQGSEKERDVDITVMSKNESGEIIVFKGIEVKDEAKPLDVITVEQLAIKLKDMPNVTHRAIVSASGYTDGARNKARNHHVDLYDLIPWQDAAKGFEHIQFSPSFKFVLMAPDWSDVVVNFVSEGLGAFDATAKVTNMAGEVLPSCSNVGSLLELVQATILNSIQSVDPGPLVERDINMSFDLDQPLLVHGKENTTVVKKTIVSGRFKVKNLSSNQQFKILVKENETLPYAGCAIVELVTGDLMGILVSNTNQDLKLFTISTNDRVREDGRPRGKIYKKQLN